MQRRLDVHAAAPAWLRGGAPRAGSHDGGLRAERAGAAFAGAARREPDRLRRLRHRGGRGAGLHRRRCRRRGTGPPQGGGPTAVDRRHGQSQPAGLHLRPVVPVRCRGGLPGGGGNRPHAAPAGLLQRAQGAGPDRSARPGRTRHRVRRDAADRGQSSPRLPGAEGDGTPRASRCGGVARRGAIA